MLRNQLNGITPYEQHRRDCKSVDDAMFYGMSVCAVCLMLAVLAINMGWLS